DLRQRHQAEAQIHWPQRRNLHRPGPHAEMAEIAGTQGREAREISREVTPVGSQEIRSLGRPFRPEYLLSATAPAAVGRCPIGSASPVLAPPLVVGAGIEPATSGL